MKRVATGPTQFPSVEEGVRRCALSHFPYAIYYSIEEPGIVVMAIVHRRRNPEVWKRRI